MHTSELYRWTLLLTREKLDEVSKLADEDEATSFVFEHLRHLCQDPKAVKKIRERATMIWLEEYHSSIERIRVMENTLRGSIVRVCSALKIEIDIEDYGRLLDAGKELPSILESLTRDHRWPKPARPSEPE